jgi:hypothetical protein
MVLNFFFALVLSMFRSISGDRGGVHWLASGNKNPVTRVVNGDTRMGSERGWIGSIESQCVPAGINESADQLFASSMAMFIADEDPRSSMADGFGVRKAFKRRQRF